MHPPCPLITLMTDFGSSSPYVAALKGVILSINPRAQLIDLSHVIRPQAIASGARYLAEVSPWFPAGTIHLSVIDPGVGSDRKMLYAQFGEQHYVAPDNGLLSGLALVEKPTKMVALTETRFWRTQVSPTFHGRDVMAPVVAHLSLGVSPDELGPSLEQFTRLDLPEGEILANQIQGEVVSVDSFGNLITNITREMLEEVPVDDSTGIFCDEHETRGIFTTYSDQPKMTLIALIGSNDCLELAIVGDSAKLMLSVGEGERVVVMW